MNDLSLFLSWPMSFFIYFFPTVQLRRGVMELCLWAPGVQLGSTTSLKGWIYFADNLYTSIKSTVLCSWLWRWYFSHFFNNLTHTAAPMSSWPKAEQTGLGEGGETSGFVFLFAFRFDCSLLDNQGYQIIFLFFLIRAKPEQSLVAYAFYSEKPIWVCPKCF